MAAGFAGIINAPEVSISPNVGESAPTLSRSKLAAADVAGDGAGIDVGTGVARLSGLIVKSSRQRAGRPAGSWRGARQGRFAKDAVCNE
jgi:hypothetical protein